MYCLSKTEFLDAIELFKSSCLLPDMTEGFQEELAGAFLVACGGDPGGSDPGIKGLETLVHFIYMTGMDTGVSNHLDDDRISREVSQLTGLIRGYMARYCAKLPPRSKKPRAKARQLSALA